MLARTASLLAVLLLATACGQRGDLYLPERDREVVASVPTGAAAAPAASDEDDNEDVQNPAAPPATDPVPGR
jgi:predicted small lipoprotein YifL